MLKRFGKILVFTFEIGASLCVWNDESCGGKQLGWQRGQGCAA